MIRAIDLEGLEKKIMVLKRNEDMYITKINVLSYRDKESKKLLDMGITLDGIDYTGKDILVLNIDNTGKLISHYSPKKTQ